MGIAGDFLGYLVPFLVVLTVLVFVHELGHYWVARRAGVRVEVFSIGFGPEIWHRIDGAGTRWRIAWIPVGGYVKFFGDADPASAGAIETPMTDAEKSVSFHHKPLSARSAIVVAGPLANLIFAVLAFAALAMTVGLPHTAPTVGAIQDGSAAAVAGLRPGDRFLEIDGAKVERFQDLQRIVRLKPEQALRAVVERDGQRLEIVTTPRRSVLVDRFGNKHEIGLLGISQSGVEMRRYGPIDGLWFGFVETWQAIDTTLTAVGQMIVGREARMTSVGRSVSPRCRVKWPRRVFRLWSRSWPTCPSAWGCSIFFRFRFSTAGISSITFSKPCADGR